MEREDRIKYVRQQLHEALNHLLDGAKPEEGNHYNLHLHFWLGSGGTDRIEVMSIVKT